MGGKKQRKVAYAVFRGRIAGVFSTYAEAEKQVKGFSHAEFRGYTEDDGGYNAAVKAFEDYTRKHEHPLKQLQTPPRTQTVKRKERPASWQAEKDAPCKVQQIKNDGRGLGAQASIVTKIPHTAASSAPSASSYSSTSVTDSREARSEDSTSDKGSSSSEDSASEEDGETPRFKNPLKDNGRSTCVEKDKTSDSSSDHGNSESTSDSDAMDEHRDDADKDTRQDFRHSNPRNKAVSALDGSNSINLRDGNKNGFSYHPQLGKPQASELRYDLSPILRQDQTLTKRRLALFNRASERPSTSSTDYGDFPDDPGLLQWSQNLPVKAEPDMDSKPIIKNKDHGQDRKLLNYLPFLIPKTEPELCKEQKDLVNLILSGDNVFFTGSAGCDIIAYTGRAALEAGGVTLHSYAGWTPASMAKPMRRLKREAHGKKNWWRFNLTHVLIIDEVSMVENHLFERLNRVMKDARGNERPFGGVQIIVTGDFCQLPPVKPFQYWGECKYFRIPFYGSHQWAFRSDAWEECDFKHVNLTKIHRQKDMRFIQLLEKCRFGWALNEEDKEILQKPLVNHELHSNQTKLKALGSEIKSGDDRLRAIKLFPKRNDVQLENEEQLALVENECFEFNCVEKLDWNPEHIGLDGLSEPGVHEHTLKALDEHSFDATLELKQGMPVILLVNLSLAARLINGSQGILIGYEEHDPQKLPETLGAHGGRKQSLMKTFVERAYQKKWPIVRFPDSNNLERTIYPHRMMSELGDGGENDDEYSLLSRTQIPLLAAWAISIHKSQGMTLTRAEVNLSRAWDQSQRYVALSRVRDPQGLTVASWGDCNTGLNAQVQKFLEENELLDTKFLESKEIKATEP